MGAINYDNPVVEPVITGVNLSWVRIDRLGSLPRIVFLMTEGYYATDPSGSAINNDLGIHEWKSKGSTWAIPMGLNNPKLAAAGITSWTEPQESLGGASFSQALATALVDLQNNPGPEKWGMVLYLFDDAINATSQTVFKGVKEDGTIANMPSMIG